MDCTIVLMAVFMTTQQCAVSETIEVEENILENKTQLLFEPKERLLQKVSGQRGSKDYHLSKWAGNLEKKMVIDGDNSDYKRHNLVKDADKSSEELNVEHRTHGSNFAQETKQTTNSKGSDASSHDRQTTDVNMISYNSYSDEDYIRNKGTTSDNNEKINRNDQKDRCQISTTIDESDLLYTKSRPSKDRRDMFNCSVKCHCKYQHDAIHVLANCVDEHLKAIPGDLPKETLNLDISYNNISKINLFTVFIYKSLKELHATDCYIQTIANAATGSSLSLQILDLRYNHINSLSGRAFVGFPNLLVLLLTGNRMQYVKRDFFVGLSNLQFVDLSLNHIQVIDNTSFNDLTSLQMLSLSGNRYLGYKVLTFDLFKQLKGLKSLKIQGSSNGATEYPNEAIGVLTNLEDLNIDALAYPAAFGFQFAKLNHLKVLRFGPHADCRLVNMPDSFFEHLSKLRCLYYHSCNISHLNQRAYKSFDKLEALTIDSEPSMTLDAAFEHLRGFKTKSLKYIGFINLTFWNWPCIWLVGEQGKPMIGFNLTTINLSLNRLSLLNDSFIDTIPKTVETLILRGNKFTLFNNLWTSLRNLRNLTNIDVSFQNMEKKNHYSPFHLERGYTGPTSYPTTGSTRRNKLYEEKRSNTISEHGGYPMTSSIVEDNNGIMHVPINLQTVQASSYNFFGGILLNNKIGKNNLKNLNFSNSGLHIWGSGKLPENVKFLDLSLNSATFINSDFFHPNNSLLQLLIQVNFLGEFIGGANGSVFRHLKNLIYLDLSRNVIFEIPFDFFNGLKEVKTIVLTDNRLEGLNVSFELTPNLNFLDLHQNSLSWISETTRNHLDKLSLKPSGMTVDLHYNYLTCTCDSIDILHWMVETRVYFLNMPLYTCRDIRAKLIPITSRQEIKLTVDYLRRYCISYGYLMFGLIAIGLIVLITTTAGMSYRYRWWIRYKKHVLFAKWFGFRPNSKRQQDGLHYKYDAFLLYVDGDGRFAHACSKELEAIRDHHLCIGNRDILPGTSEIAGIVSAVQNSRTTLVAITDNFVKDMKKHFRENPMLDYAIQMAIMEESSTKRKTLHLILCTNYDDVKYPPYVLKVLRDDCMTCFPFDGDASVTNDMIQAFWDRLSSAIGHAERCNRDEENEDDHSFCFLSYRYGDGALSQ